MTIEIITSLFMRDLTRLKKEIESYSSEINLWKTDHNISNSAGNLCLHLMGNLNHFIGKEMGNTGYIRNREQEFSLKNIPRATLMSSIEECIQMIPASLNQLSEDDLIKEYPLKVFEEKTSTGYMLIHLTTHLSYHLGQINYHRRLLDL